VAVAAALALAAAPAKVAAPAAASDGLLKNLGVRLEEEEEERALTHQNPGTLRMLRICMNGNVPRRNRTKLGVLGTPRLRMQNLLHLAAHCRRT